MGWIHNVGILQGAFWGLMIGLVVGLIRFIWEFSYSVPACGEEDTRPAVITQVHYLHFGIILWFIVTVATIVISLLTKPIPEKCVSPTVSRVTGPRITIAIWRCHKPISQWQWSFHLKAAVLLVRRLATSDRSYNTGPWPLIIVLYRWPEIPQWEKECGALMFRCCWPEHPIEQTIELPIISVTMTPIWRHRKSSQKSLELTCLFFLSSLYYRQHGPLLPTWLLEIRAWINNDIHCFCAIISTTVWINCHRIKGMGW